MTSQNGASVIRLLGLGTIFLKQKEIHATILSPAYEVSCSDLASRANVKEERSFQQTY